MHAAPRSFSAGGLEAFEAAGMTSMPTNQIARAILMGAASWCPSFLGDLIKEVYWMERGHPCKPPIFSRMGKDKVGLLLDHIESTANPLCGEAVYRKVFGSLFECVIIPFVSACPRSCNIFLNVTVE